LKKFIKIFYWSPSLVNIATNDAVINSAYSMSRYDDIYDTYILNFFGEFERFRKKILDKNIKMIDYFNKSIFNILPKHGKIQSRISFIIIFFMSFFPLKKILKKNKPDYLIIHLITSLPLILLILFNFETKFILRISGYPKMNFLRRFLWRLAFKKIHLITCPTKNTLNYIKSLDLADDSKIKLLYDPIINIKEINKKKDKEIDTKDYFLSVGRLTKQKNFMFLCKGFKELVKKDNKIKLIIIGSGEEERRLKRFIKTNNLEQNIILKGYIENIYPYFKKSKGFISTSLWEDPGFVLIEASYCRTPVLSSNAWPGPVELVKNNYNGIIFENNDLNNFLIKFEEFKNNSNSQYLKLNNLKLSRKFTLFSHYKNLNQLI
jgi:glycosyltransferase involved in cell wall biosynthesis